MAAPRYTITTNDRFPTFIYLRKKISEYDYPSTASHAQASGALKTIDQRDHNTLNTWCETYLNSKQWTQLKGALRAARKREKTGSYNKKKSTNLDANASTMLSYLAKNENVSISEIITKYLSKAYFAALDGSSHLEGDADLQDELSL